MSETPQPEASGQALVERLRAGTECNSSAGLPTCRANWPSDPASWCGGCVQLGAAEALSIASHAPASPKPSPYWAFVQRTADEVATWPDWKFGRTKEQPQTDDRCTLCQERYPGGGQHVGSLATSPPRRPCAEQRPNTGSALVRLAHETR